MDASNTNNPPSAEGTYLVLDPELYDTDSDDVPDPGLLEDKELSFAKLIPHLIMRSSLRKTWAPRARARQLWLLLRRSLHSILEKEKRSQLRVARLTHGLEPLRRLEVVAGLGSVAPDPVGKRIVVLDGTGCLHLHREDGWVLGKLPAPVSITGLVTVPGPLGALSRFVGWGPIGLAILKPDFSLLWLSEPRAPRPPPVYCLPVRARGLLLVADAGGGLELWKFRSGGRYLIPCGPTLQPQLSSTAALMRLALGPLIPNLAPRCFAAYGSAVLTLDLNTWAVIDVRQDLHKTTISDLTYCEEMEVMVTASRDTTVKVWGTDWQIQMVFVGHTGPVTALAVLPNTSLVLSASQDGTLRTWDLQAVAQVGEVLLSCWDHGRRKRLESVNCLMAPARPGWPVISLRARSAELWRLRELYLPLAQLSAPVLLLQLAPELPLTASLPPRLVCACTDGSVYLVSPETGCTVSALLLGPEDCAAAVAYCLPREALWLLTRAGHLVRANTACNPVQVLLRSSPQPAPAPRPCCLHLYSHLVDPSSAFTTWEAVCQHRGELSRSNIRNWKDKNRYLPVVGHTDGSLSVLNWLTLESAFRIEAHSPGPVTAMASTWNTVVSSGGDLTVKTWRVFPYSEESLSPLRTLSCCHPAPALCALGRSIMVAFEDPDSATFGLVQLGLHSSQRFDHRPQDDHLDHMTGLCSCPPLHLYASSSLDCTIRIWTSENRLLRLLQLNGAPQALTFSSNKGDLVLALGSRLCLVSHRFYLPTTYLLKNLCQKAPDTLDDPALPLTSQESLSLVQLQRLASLREAASFRSASGLAEPAGRLPPSSRGLATLLKDCPGLSPVLLSIPPAISVCSSALSFIRRWTAVPQQPLLKEDLEPLLARDQDLQELIRGEVVPAARAPLSWQQQLEAFDDYLCLIYGPTLLGMQSRTEPQLWPSAVSTVKSEDVSTLPSTTPSLVKAGVRTDPSKTLPQKDWGALSLHLAQLSQVALPIPLTHPRVHSRASQLLARSSLSSYLGLSVDLQLRLEHLLERRPAAPGAPSSHLKSRVPLLLERRPKDLPTNLGGFFPAAVQTHKDLPRPIHFPGWVPNSSVLQKLWLPQEISGLGALPQLTRQDSAKPTGSQEDVWLLRTKRQHTRSQIQWTGEEEDEDLDLGLGLELDLDLDMDLHWSIDYQSPSSEPSQELLQESPSEIEAATGVVTTPLQIITIQELRALVKGRLRKALAGPSPFYNRHRLLRGHSFWDLRYGHLPRFLHFFVLQNWFKKLFPLFTLEAYPEVGTVDGLSWWFMDLLREVSWEDRVHILRALLRLLPDMSQSLYKRLQEILMDLLNMDPPPDLQELAQKQFVMLALQLQLACSLESREVVLELMSYLLYSPATFRPELEKLLEGLGLQDPEGFLFREMMTWVQDLDMHCKAMLRNRCSQKLDELTHLMKVETLQPPVAKLSDVLPKVSETALSQVPSTTSSHLAVPALASGRSSPLSLSIISSTPSQLLVPRDLGSVSLAPVPLGSVSLDAQAQPLIPRIHIRRSHRTLSESLEPFSSLPDIDIPTRYSAPDALPEYLLPLEQTEWSRSKMLDLRPIDALNLFCEQQRRSWLVEEAAKVQKPLRLPPNAVVPQPLDHRLDPILRLQEMKRQGPAVGLKAQLLARHREGLTPDGSIRTLKLPLPRVELRPFPLGWPRPARPLPPQPLQPALRRYFLPDLADPDFFC